MTAIDATAVVVFLGLLTAYFVGYLVLARRIGEQAGAQGHSRVAWTVACLLFGPWAWLVWLLVRQRSPR